MIKTRFSELGYVNDGPRLWRIVDLAGGHPNGRVGPQYQSKSELLSDLERFADVFGCSDAVSPRKTVM